MYRAKFLLIMFFAGVLFVACDRLPSREQVSDAADRGQSAAATAQVVAATKVVEAQAAATRLAEQGIDVQTAATRGREAAGTAAVIAQSAATRIREDGPSAVATIKAYGTPVVSLGQKFRETRPDENGNIYITISEAELTQALTWHNPATDDGMRNTRATIEDGEIRLIAEVTTPVQGTLTVAFRPVIEDGDIQLDIASAQVGGVGVPRILLNSAESRINNTLLLATSLIPGSTTYTNITASSGFIAIYGQK